MRLFGTFRTAFRALLRNPTRAFLTTLGIIIGIGAVIAMMEIGAGSSASIRRSIASMGADNLLIHPGGSQHGGVRQAAGTQMTLLPEDYEAIVRECFAIRAAAPVVGTRAQIIWHNRDWSPNQIQGSTPSFLIVKNWENLAEGEMFTERDVQSSAQVCVIGQTIRRELFAGRNPLGQNIRIKDVTFKVIGVLAKKGANMFGQDQDDVVIMPWTTLRYRLSGSRSNAAVNATSSTEPLSNSALYPSTGPEFYPETTSSQTEDTLFGHRFTTLDAIMITARSANHIDAAIQEITHLLRQRHRITGDAENDFNIWNFSEMSDTLSQTSTVMTNLLLCVAMISLIVGGVGIMNIMLVSVTERTREIGLRMAVGARSGDILIQFLVESIVLCMIGGILGIALGHGGSRLLAYVLKWPTETSPEAIIAAVAVSAGVGMVFGFYPAWKASKLDPIDALRYE